MTVITGAYGTAHRIPPTNYQAHARAALDGWIITAPIWHPLWSQYTLSVVTLADIPGVPAANKQRPDVTHELLVAALNPEHGPVRAEDVQEGSLRLLTPVNIAEQVTTTDERAVQLAELCARAVVDGVLCPETLDAPDLIRTMWRTSIHQTFDHHRDPHHGRN
ncbi:hypothetical protein [Sphaerisporangium album]|uniref:hypothetical protein n=1 Tax=Sphaerisporangium album TaxID=509200 RepID=UPI0015F047C0|nr:hypothetical protein [Sphaerisporangium album]